MKKKFLILLASLVAPAMSFAFSGQEYMDRFNTYLAFSQRLPINPTPSFLAFVSGDTPLSNKLRDRWLYELARTKDWSRYTQYYQPTQDIHLACYYQIARYQLGAKQAALADSESLWLSGESKPAACNHLFDLLIKDPDFNQHLITQRIHLALEKRNPSLARYLIKLYKVPQPAKIEALNKITQNPSAIATLTPGALHGEFYLYGLKRLFSTHMSKALMLWEQSKKTDLMSDEQQQNFLVHVALYKALRQQEDTTHWFNQIKPQYYTEALLDWQIRFALKKQNWQQVSALINQASNKDTPCWQYWLARALEKQKQKPEAQLIYEKLAKERNYYGFLASLRLKQSPHFLYERPSYHLGLLKPYTAFLEQIKNLYHSKQTAQASRLLNDFMSELPKNEASALVYWIDKTLQWYGKSVYLSNNEILTNQLDLRFPLPHQNIVTLYAKKYNLSPEFIYSIIRQESGFREDVISPAGARGLMQLMPSTAHMIAKAEKINYTHPDQLFLFEKNIQLGTAYLKQLGKRFNNHPIIMAAAYNAGPKQAVHWLNNHSAQDLDLWIEILPWQETRNYLKNIFAFYVVYQYRLQQKITMSPFLDTH